MDLHPSRLHLRCDREDAQVSKRPKWMSSEDFVDRLVGGISELEPFVSAECRRTGIRAQIEVLEEMLSRLGGYSNSTKGYCEAKIAALRKELE